MTDDLERSARAANQCYQTHGHLQAGAIDDMLAVEMQWAALLALLPSSEEAIEKTAEAIMLATTCNNPANPPRWPRDFSLNERWEFRNQARAAITAYITFIAGEGP